MYRVEFELDSNVDELRLSSHELLDSINYLILDNPIWVCMYNYFDISFWNSFHSNSHKIIDSDISNCTGIEDEYKFRVNIDIEYHIFLCDLSVATRYIPTSVVTYITI